MHCWDKAEGSFFLYWHVKKEHCAQTLWSSLLDTFGFSLSSRVLIRLRPNNPLLITQTHHFCHLLSKNIPTWGDTCVVYFVFLIYFYLYILLHLPWSKSCANCVDHIQSERQDNLTLYITFLFKRNYPY